MKRNSPFRRSSSPSFGGTRGKKSRRKIDTRQAAQRQAQRPSGRLSLDWLEERTLLSTLDLVGGTYAYNAAAGVANNLAILQGAGTYTFDDPAETAITLTPAAAAVCAAVDANTVVCSDAGITSVEVDLDDEDDTATLSALIFPGGPGTVLMDGGDGVNGLIFFGTTLDDEFDVEIAGDGVVELEGFVTAITTGIQDLTLVGFEGDDQFEIERPVVFDHIDIQGGDPSASDVLKIEADDGPAEHYTITPDNAKGSGKITESKSGLELEFTGVELISVLGSGNDDVQVKPGRGDHVMRLQNGVVNQYDVLISSTLPNIEFTALRELAITTQDLGNLEVTVVTGALAGAGRYDIELDETDTLNIEGGNTSDDDYAVVSQTPGHLDVTDNVSGVTIHSDEPGSLKFYTLGGDDKVTVDVGSTDVIQVPITFDGGLGSDLLEVSGTPLTPVDEVIYRPGPAVTEGRLVYEDDDDFALMTIDFLNLEPVIELVPASTLTVHGTDADNAINYSASPTDRNRGRVTVDAYESIEFANKDHLVLNGLAGSDLVHLNNPTTPDDLDDITVNGGDPTASSDTLVVNGTTGSDTITFIPHTPDSATITGAGPLPINGFTIEQVVINGRGGADEIVVQTAAADADLIFYTPELTRPDAASVQVIADSENVGMALVPMRFENIGHGIAGQGFVVIDGQDGINDELTYFGTALDDQYEVKQNDGLIVLGPDAQVQLDGHVPVFTTRVEDLKIDGLDGDDSFVFRLPLIYEDITVQGNDQDHDTLDVVADPNALDNITVSHREELGHGKITDTAFPLQKVAFRSIDLVFIEGNVEANPLFDGLDTLTVEGTSADDQLRLLPGTFGDRIEGNFQVPVEARSDGKSPGFAKLTVDMSKASNASFSGNDTLTVQMTRLRAATLNTVKGKDTEVESLVLVGTDAADTFTDSVSGSTTTFTVTQGANTDTISFTSTHVDFVELDGEAGNDLFTVTPLVNASIFVDGGDPIGVMPGDKLTIVPSSGPVVFFTGPEVDEGGFLVDADRPVSFDHIEMFGPIVAPPACAVAVVFGTDSDDDITIIARDSSTHAGTDGVQDFTVSVNGSPELLFVNFPTLFVDALSGDDDIVLRAPAPNNAAWDVSMTVVGGPPSAVTGDQGDVFEVETPGAGAETVVYTPTSSETGTMVITRSSDAALVANITLASGPVALPAGCPALPFPIGADAGGIETLIYDGESDIDSLTVVGTTGNDLIVHTPGGASDEGAVRVNNLLGLNYQNIGSGASVTVDGGGSVSERDTLTVLGTSLDDVIDVESSTGAVTLVNSAATHVPVVPEDIHALVLDGLDGDDLFDIGATQAYHHITVLGGSPGGSDALRIIGESGEADTFTVLPGFPITSSGIPGVRGVGTVDVNGVAITYIGMEHILLESFDASVSPFDALDSLTISDDLADNVWTIDAGPRLGFQTLDFATDRVQIDDRESIDYFGFDTVELINSFGTDSFRVYPTSLTGFDSSFTVNANVGAGVPANDVLQLVGTEAVDTLTSGAATITFNSNPITVGGAGAGFAELSVSTLGGNDSITLSLALPGVRKVVDSGAGNDTITMTGTTDANIFAGDGDDSVIGSAVADFIDGGRGNDTINGGAGNDTIYGADGNDRLDGDAGTDQMFGGDGSDLFVWDPGDGNDLIEGGDDASDVLLFNGSAANETFTLSAVGTRLELLRATASGLVDMDIAGVEQIDINALAGDDTVNVLDLTETEVVLVNLNLGGADSDADLVVVDGRTVADNVLITLAANTADIAGLPYEVEITGSEIPAGSADRLTFRANDGDDTVKAAAGVESAILITLDGGAGNDLLSADATLIGGSGDDTLVGGAGGDSLVGNDGEDVFVHVFDGNGSTDTIDGGAGGDTILVVGTEAGETISLTTVGAEGDLLVSVGAFSVTYTDSGVGGINGAGLEHIRVLANAGSDTINVTPLSAISVFVDGGDPIGVMPGDKLNVNLGGQAFLFFPGPEVDEGGFLVGTNQPVSFDHIEMLGPIVGPPGGGCPAVIFGTDVDDDITIIARDSSTHAGTDGVQDFTVTVNDGPELLFINYASLVVDALAGDDDIVLRTPAPNGAAWNVTLTVIGGPPSAVTGDQGDVLEVETPASGAETVVYTPTSSETGTMVIRRASDAALIANVAISAGPFVVGPSCPPLPSTLPGGNGGIEHVIYDGEADNDSMTVVGTSGDDIIVHTAGGAADEGSFRVNDLLGIDYQNFGIAGSLTVDGAASSDTLEYPGTDFNDTFNVAANGSIDLRNPLGNHVDVGQIGVENLELDGLGGDDTFNIAAPQPYTNIAVNGQEPDASDVLNLTGTASNDAIVVNLGPSTITGFGGTVSFTGIEDVNLAGGGGAADTLTVNGTLDDDLLTYRPTGAAAGTFNNATKESPDEPATDFTFSAITGTFTVAGGAASADELIVEATNSRDTITIDGTVRTVQVNALKTVTLDSSTEIINAKGRDGSDTFVVTPALGVGGSLDNLLIYVDGGAPGSSDALVVNASGSNQFVVVNRSRADNEGVVRVFQDTPGVGNAPGQMPDIAYLDVEIVSPDVFVDAAGDPNLLIMGPDFNEPNEFRANATYLGSGSAINLAYGTIFPNAFEHPFVPQDQDFYRVVAQKTGTLDFQVYFRQLNPELVPAGGDLQLQLFDVDGTLIVSGAAGGFGTNDSSSNERIRIPAVQGQTYYLRVFGAVNTAVNNYDLTVTNEVPPVPYDFELDDTPVLVPPSPADLCPLVAGEENSDSGRSQFDNHTCDSTPLLRFRIDDGSFLFDLPGNDGADAPPDEVIPIPFRGDSLTAGYRVAVFEEGQPQQPGGLPQTLLGFATQVAAGIYEFDFDTNTLDPNFTLSEGSHFISARVQMVDPATPTQTGFGARSVSLEIVVDTTEPTVFFGYEAVSDDGLDPASDSGVIGRPDTFRDRITNDTTPSFFGTAEADAVVRVWADRDGDGVVDLDDGDGVIETGEDVQLCETAATPLDGSNQFPNGQWNCTSIVDLNDTDFFAFDGLRNLLVTAEDLAGNVSAPQALNIFIDTQGPRIVSVNRVPDQDGVSVFDPKPTAGPTPLITQIDITFYDQTARIPPEFNHLAINDFVATICGNYQLVGDANGDILTTDCENVGEGIGSIPTNIAGGNLPGGGGVGTGSSAQTGGSGGVIVDGGDRDDHGDATDGPDGIPFTADDVTSDGWRFIEQMVEFALTGARNGKTGILAIGPDANTDAEEAIRRAAAVLGTTVTVVNDADISTAVFTDFAVMYVPTCCGNTSGGIDDSELMLLEARKTDVQNFVNSGGSLVALEESGATNPFGWLELPDPFVTTNNSNDEQYQTPELGAAGLMITNQELINGTPLHQQFTGPPGFNGLVPFVCNTGPNGVQDGPPCGPGSGNDDEIITLGLAPGSAGIGGVPGVTKTIRLTFAAPLPDDRFTLTVFDRISDDVGNALDGDSQAQSPGTPADFLPSGDAVPGEDFSGRFTVDSRPEIGTFCCGTWNIDLNGNGSFDLPNNHDTDYTNADIVWHFGNTSDRPVVGNWADSTPTGFDKIGVYGPRSVGTFHFELDLDSDGAFDPAVDASFPFGSGGRPIAGHWQAIGGEGSCDSDPAIDCVGVFDGKTWFIDLNGNQALDTNEEIPTNFRGLPIAGDWTGSGVDRVGTFQNDTFFLDIDGDFQFDPATDREIAFGFHTPLQIPVAADYDGDGDDNIGLFVQDRNAQFPREAAEWYLDNGLPNTGPFFGTTGDPGDGLFQPPPTGRPTIPSVFQDYFFQFGDELAAPVIGNFDPPVRSATTPTPPAPPAPTPPGPLPTSLTPVLAPPVMPTTIAGDDHPGAPGATATAMVADSTGMAMGSGAIESKRDKDVFQFTATQSGHVVIDLMTPFSDLDTKLTVMAGKKRIAKSDNFGGGTDSHVQIDVVAGQTYYLQVQGKRSTGSYELIVDSLLSAAGSPAAASTTPAVLPLGGGIDTAGEADYYSFRASGDGTLQFSAGALSAALDPVVDVYDSTGQLVAHAGGAASSDAVVSLNASAGQTYYIRIRARGSDTGMYDLAIDWVLANGV